MTTTDSSLQINGPISPAHTGETAATAVAAQAAATIQARYAVAYARPRDRDDARDKLLRECKRPNFALEAIYKKPIGKGVSGPSIRFAETALRCWGNVSVSQVTTLDTQDKRIVNISVTDLEDNYSVSKDVEVTKTVERRQLRSGQNPIGSRTNSTGQTVYIVEASEDDLLTKEAALCSKALRVCALRIIPGDLTSEALEVVRDTQSRGTKTDPDTQTRKLADAFSGLGVRPSALREYLGHDLGESTPAELSELKTVYASLRDGESTWADFLIDKLGEDVGQSTQSVKDLRQLVKEAMPERKARPRKSESAGTGPKTKDA